MPEIPASVADFSSESLDDDASNLTSITLELYRAAQKTMCHARSKKQIGAAIPVHVKEAMLEDAYPHVRGSGQYNARVHDDEDCVQSISESEIAYLRHAMHSHEKQRLMETMEQLSRQLETFHEVLEENENLKQQLARAKRESEDKASDLEKKFIDMKLTLAEKQSREDHTRLKTAKLETNLKKTQEENRRLQQKLEGRGGGKLRDARKVPEFLTQSMTSAGSPKSNVRSGEPLKTSHRLLTRSWFGQGSSRADHAKCPARNARFSRSSSTSTPMREEPLARKPAVDGAHRGRSFADPKKSKSRASEGSAFMHWDSISAISEDEGPTGKGGARNRNHVLPKEAAVLSEPMGAYLRFGGNDSVGGIHGSVLSNITDGTFETRGGGAATEQGGHVSKGSVLSNITDSTFETRVEAAGAEHCRYSSKHGEDAMSTDASRGSYGAVEFEPAQPRLQQTLSLRGVAPPYPAPRPRSRPRAEGLRPAGNVTATKGAESTRKNQGETINTE